MHSIEEEAVKDSWLKRQILNIYKLFNGDFKATAVRLCQNNPAIDFDEVTAVAKLAQQPLEDFCMLQCAYEVAARCSSIIAPLLDGESPHRHPICT